MHHDDYLERAQECLKLAAETADRRLRESLTQAAVRWEQLADRDGRPYSGIFSIPSCHGYRSFICGRRRSAAPSERASVMRRLKQWSDRSPNTHPYV